MMEVTSFRLMPYRPLDLEAAKEFRSAWVVKPNTLFDQRTLRGVDLIARIIQGRPS